MNLIICPPLRLKKPTASVRRTIEIYSRFSMTHVTVCVDKSSMDDADPDLLNKLHLFDKVLYGRINFGIGLFRTVLRLTLEARRNDLVFAYDEFHLSVFFAYVVSRLSRKPLLIMFHIVVPEVEKLITGERGGITGWLYRKALKYSSGVICLDNGRINDMIASIMPGKRIYLTSNGTEVPAETVSKNGELYDGLFLGVLQERKGIHYLPEIWKSVMRRHSAAKLKLVGKEVDGNVLKISEKLSEIGIIQNVDFVGFVEYGEKLDLLERAKVFVFPSTDEGISLSLLEALSYGIPAVVWDLPVFDCFESSVIRVKYPDVEDYALKVADLLDNEDYRKRTGDAARKWVLENMSWDKAAEREEVIFSNFTSLSRKSR